MLSEVTLSMLSGFLQGSGRQVAPLDGRHVRSDCSSNTAQQQHTQQQHYNYTARCWRLIRKTLWHLKYCGVRYLLIENLGRECCGWGDSGD